MSSISSGWSRFQIIAIQITAKQCYSVGPIEHLIQVQPVLRLHPGQANGREESAGTEFPGLEAGAGASADAGHDVDGHVLRGFEAGEMRRGV